MAFDLVDILQQVFKKVHTSVWIAVSLWRHKVIKN